jgi:hypothetical protein
MKPHEKHFQIVEMYYKGRPFLDIDKKLGLKTVYEARSYLESIGLFKMATVAEMNRKINAGEEW